MAFASPLNLKQWIDQHRDILKPPVGNKCVYHDAENFIVMVVGGPNARKDYHYNESEELFYQLEGDITVKVQVKNKCVEVKIKEGEMFLLPPKIPHSPIRPKNTIGLVVEKKRPNSEKDGLLWFCDKCNNTLHETYFELNSIEKDFLPRYKEFYSSEKLRTCSNCNYIMEVDKRFL